VHRPVAVLLFAVAALSAQAKAQLVPHGPSSATSFVGALTSFDPGEGSGGGGQVEPSAYADRYLTRLAVSSSGSTLGTGAQLATNLQKRLDLRVFGDYTNFNFKLTQNGFYAVVHFALANTGAMADYYPWKSLRLSPGYLYYNTNHITATVNALSGTTFTLNNVNYASDDANPVRGAGALTLGGTGFMATAGWGHYVSRNEKRWHFPFEGGVALINNPGVTASLAGEVCAVQGVHCLPATSYPGLEANLNAQIATWNRRIAPFHIYPLINGGISYTFRLWR
jgi:hypothetical protein